MLCSLKLPHINVEDLTKWCGSFFGYKMISIKGSKESIDNPTEEKAIEKIDNHPFVIVG